MEVNLYSAHNGQEGFSLLLTVGRQPTIYYTSILRLKGKLNKTALSYAFRDVVNRRGAQNSDQGRKKGKDGSMCRVRERMEIASC